MKNITEISENIFQYSTESKTAKHLFINNLHHSFFVYKTETHIISYIMPIAEHIRVLFFILRKTAK